MSVIKDVENKNDTNQQDLKIVDLHFVKSD